MNYATVFGKELLDLVAAANNPMNDEQMRQFITVCTMNEGGLKEVDDLIKRDFIGQVLVKRLSAYAPHVKLHTRVLMWIILMSDGNPSYAVMLAAAATHVASQHNNFVTIDDMIEAMPWSVPTREVFETMWDKQKTHEDGLLDNKLDIQKYWTEEN